MRVAAKKKLGEYERKRDFGTTPEPAPRRRRKKASAPRFVVQEHSARRLHWDLRLEHEGVAVSWAIPNGIPDDPAENRKAVHTEDHPLEYMDFEGEIPAGEYGGGTVQIWDRGTYQCHKWEERKVVLSFEGERLSGRYALFQAGGEKDWMIHRMDPPSERRDPFPESVVPMLAKLSKLPASDERWAAEVKLDGVRAIAYCRPGRLELQSRNLQRRHRPVPGGAAALAPARRPRRSARRRAGRLRRRGPPELRAPPAAHPPDRRHRGPPADEKPPGHLCDLRPALPRRPRPDGGAVPPPPRAARGAGAVGAELADAALLDRSRQGATRGEPRSTGWRAS